LLAGDLSVYVDNSSGSFTPDELSAIQDAIDNTNSLLVPYNVAVTEVSDPSLANLTIDSAATSACGGLGQGVLGCYNADTAEVTLIQGWDWYAGADPTAIGASQYSFETTVTHELGHALGLGGSNDPSSPMYETLPTGVVKGGLTTADLNVGDLEGSADPLRAAPAAPTSGGSAAAAGSTAGAPGGPSACHAHRAGLSAGQWLADAALMLAAWGNPSVAGQVAAWAAVADWAQSATGASNTMLAQDALFASAAGLLPGTSGFGSPTQAS
jgi:hypothetical protein